MVGIDHLFANSLNGIIRETLGKQATKKIEDRLFEKFGISLTQSIEEFDKLDLVLREFFGKGADGLEKKFFENVFQTKSKKSKSDWYTITDSHVNQVILQAFGDYEKKKILESVSAEPKIIQDILKECDIPQTSGYRKINSLIDDGLIATSGQVVTENKKINKYLSVFSNLKINISIEKDNKVTIDAQLNNLQKQTSSILKTIQF
ncbi:MAG: hypothetical protein R3327_02375 [Nitrosopumilaceae archaeon]|nr:hypothetical protein [Nitrosopumilaceae archaeon]